MIKESSHFLSFQTNFRNVGIRLMKLGLFVSQFQKILKICPIFIQVFAQRGHRYTRRLILWPISAASPRIDLSPFKQVCKFNWNLKFTPLKRLLFKERFRSLLRKIGPYTFECKFTSFPDMSDELECNFTSFPDMSDELECNFTSFPDMSDEFECNFISFPDMSDEFECNFTSFPDMSDEF